MVFSTLNYNEPLFRPPSEAYSLIFQITLGCSWNKCSFCEMYASKKFKARTEKDIFAEITEMKSQAPNTRKVFLADGNAFVLSFSRLMRIMECLNNNFPKLNRVSAYALPSDIISKSNDELKQLADAGLKLLYVGIESGDDELLKVISKSETYNSTVEALVKARKAGIKLSVMILNGLGGLNFTEQHALNSAKVINEIQPEYLSTLVLSYPYGVDHYKQKFNGEFIELSTLELIREMRLFINNLKLNNTIFRSDHASNYLILKGILNRDRDKFIQRTNNILDNPDQANLRPEYLRGL
jgi:radical SAM superfamily enzyme YgiQ (UPF0313 family)